MSILVTGGAGYIGSHTCIKLLEAGYNVIVVDNLVNSSKESIRRVETITGKTIRFYEADIADETTMDCIFSENPITAVVHFAGLKAVGESVQKPILYYKNNLSGTLSLLNVMDRNNVRSFVFSSSATVYGLQSEMPISEDASLGATNPYGYTKLMIERFLKDIYHGNNQWAISILRYFNPIGAHPSGMIGEDPKGIPNNLMPYIAQVAAGKLKELSVFGDDYDTPDGTGVRDYIHVMDLAQGHICALKKIESQNGLFIHNLGTGMGYSVLDIIQAFEKVNQIKIPYRIVGRRPGDIAICYADPAKARSELGFVTELDIEDMCRDTWNWQKNNPDGYK